tara:strand:+ start:13114 stop:16710 length:3597 start_codon:yes stop_codon:yes gene_type:complete
MKGSKEMHLKNTNTTNVTPDNKTYDIIKYWRHSLADMARMGLKTSEIKQSIPFSFNELKKGSLPTTEVAKLFEDAERYKKRELIKNIKYQKRKLTEDDYRISNLQMLIAPFTVVRCHQHGLQFKEEGGKARTHPLLLAANLNRDGTLSVPDNNILPWIDRRCLLPNNSSSLIPILGTISDVDHYYDENDCFNDDALSWADYFMHGYKLFEYLIDKFPENELLQGNCIRIDEGLLCPYSDNQFMTRNIIETYETYIKNKKKIPKLLENFCSLNAHHSATDMPLSDIFKASQNHYGQMHSNYPLSKSQRESLSYFFDKADNDIFTINGPPGTGKTTLLLSIISSKWIEAIVEKKQFPPIIVAASTNNQAVTNILDHFQNANKVENSNNSIRWLPNLNGFGLFLVGSKEEKVPYLHIKKRKSLGNIWGYITQEYNLEATGYYLNAFNKHFNSSKTELTECAQHIRSIILDKTKQLTLLTQFIEQYHQKTEELKSKYSSLEDLASFIETSKVNVKTHSETLFKLKESQIKWLQWKSSDIKWLRMISFLPAIKKLILDKAKLFVIQNNILSHEKFSSIESIDTLIETNLIDLGQKCSDAEKNNEELERFYNMYMLLDKEKNNIEQILNCQFNIESMLDLSHNGLLATLDISLRYELFILATHYWEAQWLIESQKLEHLKYNKEDRKKYWATHAMLTPCLVTTLHTGPAFFQQLDSGVFSTLTDFIDLLIIDEAGQTLPVIGGALISAAKKLLLVGDKHQLEPIIGLPEGVDRANVDKYINDKNIYDFERLKHTGLLCSGNANTMHSYGNLMTVGQRRTKFKLKDHNEPGLMLKEHRRCVDEIIRYCNALCYDNKLIPMVGSRNCNLPPLGYAHIIGTETKQGSSKLNQPEANTIAQWINKNKNKILRQLKLNNIADCIGIVTPFSAQTKAIESALLKQNIRNIKVGTIHKFQGGEMPIIIFSPVYSSEKEQSTFFFDVSPSMLNVAVSRAKLSFMVFGDMNIFDEKRWGLPSSLLAKYLFKSEENEIKDIISPVFDRIEHNDIEQIINLENHRHFLTKAFSIAQKTLSIVSPYLAMNAIEKDNILNLINSVTPQIRVEIYTDPTLNANKFESFHKIKDKLVKAGAEVIFVNRVHSKIMVIDDKTLCIGSFNWLSSSRDQKYKLEEITMAYYGKHVEQYITKALYPIKNKIIENYKLEPAIEIN